MMNTEQNIYSISEAFSMQPSHIYLGMINTGMKVSVIKIEKINHPVNGQPYEYDYYVVRDESGNKIAQYRAETMNVCFEKP